MIYSASCTAANQNKPNPPLMRLRRPACVSMKRPAVAAGEAVAEALMVQWFRASHRGGTCPPRSSVLLSARRSVASSLLPLCFTAAAVVPAGPRGNKKKIFVAVLLSRVGERTSIKSFIMAHTHTHTLRGLLYKLCCSSTLA